MASTGSTENTAPGATFPCTSTTPSPFNGNPQGTASIATICTGILIRHDERKLEVRDHCYPFVCRCSGSRIRTASCGPLDKAKQRILGFSKSCDSSHLRNNNQFSMEIYFKFELAYLKCIRQKRFSRPLRRHPQRRTGGQMEYHAQSLESVVFLRIILDPHNHGTI